MKQSVLQQHFDRNIKADHSGSTVVGGYGLGTIKHYIMGFNSARGINVLSKYIFVAQF